MRILSNNTVGGAGASNSTRAISNPILYAEGWAGYIEKIIEPQIQYTDQFLVANPFGLLHATPTGKVEGMQFDQYVHARDGISGIHPPLKWAVSDFVPAWKAFRQRHPGAQVIPYIGGTMKGIVAEPKTWIDRQYRRYVSIRDICHACNGIALDYMTDFGLETEEYHWAYSMAQNIPVWIEGYPTKMNPQWSKKPFNVICTEGNWNQRLAGWGADQVEGELIILADNTMRVEEYPAFVRRHLPFGRSVCLALDIYLLYGYKFEDLMP